MKTRTRSSYATALNSQSASSAVLAENAAYRAKAYKYFYVKTQT